MFAAHKNHNKMKYYLAPASILLSIIAAIVILFNLIAYRNIEYLKEYAPPFIEEIGFNITAAQGYEGCLQGGAVWYLVSDENGYIYEFNVIEWRGEIHIYSLKCLNAIDK